MPGTITVSAVVEQLEAVLGQHREAGRACAPGRRPSVHDPHVVEPVARRRRGRAPKTCGGMPRSKADDAVEGEHGDPVRAERSWPDSCT